MFVDLRVEITGEEREIEVKSERESRLRSRVHGSRSLMWVAEDKSSIVVLRVVSGVSLRVPEREPSRDREPVVLRVAFVGGRSIIM